MTCPECKDPSLSCDPAGVGGGEWWSVGIIGHGTFLIGFDGEGCVWLVAME